MILDAEKGFGHEPPRYDLCIVGAGAAGITLALELEATGLRVCLLEAGGSVYEAETQRLFEGEVVGQAYPMLRDTRVGALGGSTTVWAGWCRPLEALDFERAGLVRRRRLALRPRRASSLLCPGPRDLRARRLRLRPRALGRRPRIRPDIARRSHLQPTRSFTSRSRTSASAIVSDSSGRRPSTWCCTPRSREPAWRTRPARRSRSARSAGTSWRSARTGSCSPPEASRIPGSCCSPRPSRPAFPAMPAGSSVATSPIIRTSIRAPWCCGSRNLWASISCGRLAPSREASSVRGVLSLRREVVERERLMNAQLLLPSPLRSPPGLRDRGGEGLPAAVEQVQAAKRAGGGLAVCQAGRESPSPAGRGDGTQARGETWAGTTLANACGLRDRVPVRQPRDAERRARPPRPAQGTHRVADRRRGRREHAPRDCISSTRRSGRPASAIWSAPFRTRRRRGGRPWRPASTTWEPPGCTRRSGTASWTRTAGSTERRTCSSPAAPSFRAGGTPTPR